MSGHCQHIGFIKANLIYSDGRLYTTHLGLISSFLSPSHSVHLRVIETARGSCIPFAVFPRRACLSLHTLLATWDVDQASDQSAAALFPHRGPILTAAQITCILPATTPWRSMQHQQASLTHPRRFGRTTYLQAHPARAKLCSAACPRRGWVIVFQTRTPPALLSNKV